MTPETLVAELREALKALQPHTRATDPEWRRVEELSSQLVSAIRASEGPLARPVLNALALLREKRCFGWMARVAEALIYVGQDPPFVRRQYAQALIEQGLLVAAERVLTEALPLAAGTTELVEIQGLMGRVSKQWYVTAPEGRHERDGRTLQRAIDSYFQAYADNAQVNYWHGINVVALLERGRHDGVDVTASAASPDIARSMLAVLEQQEQAAVEPLGPWPVATMMEALLALGRHDEMLQRARELAAHEGATAFVVGSALRQLTEVWRLSEDLPPGSFVLPLLRAKLLSAPGGALMLQASAVTAERDRAAKLQLVHGFDRFQTLQWYLDGLGCCRAIARIETETGRGIGTGWLVRGDACFPQGGGDESLLVTNAHVISPADRPYQNALTPQEAVANFQVAGLKTDLAAEVVWSSPVDRLDCTILRLKRRPDAAPLRLGSSRVRLTVPPPRMYIIGHPAGRDLEFSLQDNHLLGCSDRLLHYRTPTEGGSSGSPVFNTTWRVVGLHHAGDGMLSRLDGEPGTYEANEGIAMTALLEETRSVVLSQP